MATPRQPQGQRYVTYPSQPQGERYITYDELTAILTDWLARTRQDLQQTTLAALRTDAYSQQINELYRLIGVALSNPRNGSDPRTPTIQQLQSQLSSIQQQLQFQLQQLQQPPHRGGSKSRRI
jgi:capsule polysaccharide export protein KpsE/RkpR